MLQPPKQSPDNNPQHHCSKFCTEIITHILVRKSKNFLLKSYSYIHNRFSPTPLFFTFPLPSLSKSHVMAKCPMSHNSGKTIREERNKGGAGERERERAETRVHSPLPVQ